MKRSLLPPALLVVFWAVVPSAAHAGVVHRWSFDGNVNDSVRTAHGTLINNTGNATFAGGQLTLGNTGTQTSNAGNGDYVDLPNGIISALGNHATFEAWVTWNGPSTSNWQRIFDFGRSDGGEDSSSTGANSYYVMMTPRNSTTGTYRVGYRRGLPAAVEERTISHPTSALPLGQQQHVVLVWNGTANTASMYLNGQFVASNSLHMALSDLTDVNNWLGRAQFNDPMFSGSYNEFRIYDQALPGYKVFQSYAAGSEQFANPAYPDLAHRYSFNEASGSTATDSVGGAHGVINNGALSGTGALTFNGSSTYVALPINGTVSGLASITVEGWVSIAGGSAWQRIFDFGNSSSTSYMFLSPNGSGQSRFAITTAGGTNEQRVDFTPFPTAAPVHFAVTLDDATDTARVYLNGRLMGTNTGVTLRPADLGSTVNNWLGRSQYAADPYFNGTMNELRIYGRALTPFEAGESRLVGPDQINANNVAYVAGAGPLHYVPVSLAAAVGAGTLNYNNPGLPGGYQVLGGTGGVPAVPFDVPASGNDSWNASTAGGTNPRELVVPVPLTAGRVIEVDLILGTWWGNSGNTYASLIFKATDGSQFTTDLFANSDVRDYNAGANGVINNLTTVNLISQSNLYVDMLRVVMPDDWLHKTLESITVRDNGNESLQRIFLSGLTLATVPEPSAAVLLGLGGAGLVLLSARARRRRG